MSEGPGKKIGMGPLIAVAVIVSVVVLVASLTLYRRQQPAQPGAAQQGPYTAQASVTPAEPAGIFEELEAAAEEAVAERAEQAELPAEEAGVALEGPLLPPLQDLDPLDPAEMLEAELEQLRAQEEIRREQARTAELAAALVAETTAYTNEGYSPAEPAPPALTSAESGTDERMYVLNPGTVIRGVLETDIDTSAPGQAVGRVTEPVYDSTGQRVLIQQGAQLIGEYGSDVSLEQSRVEVTWRYLVQDGETVAFGDGLAGADARGAGGFEAEVDRHFRRNLGNALLVSIFGAGVQLSQPRPREGGPYYDPAQIAAGALGQQVGALGLEYARRGTTMSPTLRVDAGYRFAIVVGEPLELPEVRV